MPREIFLIKDSDTDCLENRLDGELLDEAGWTILINNDLRFPDYLVLTSDGYSYGEYLGRFEAKSEATKKRFPLIGRLLETYADSVYSHREISALDCELNELLDIVETTDAKRFVLKFKALCRKALSEDAGLAVLTD